MSTEIHATAFVDPKAELGQRVSIGAFAQVGPGVTVGDDCQLLNHTSILRDTSLGAFNVLHPFASLGSDPQDLKYDGEPTRLEIGDHNLFRECTTINRGTGGGGGVTRIGNHNLFMAYSHVAHDCQLGNRTVFANGATLAGHVDVGDYVTVGAQSAVHQFCRIGAHAFIGGFSVLTRDVLPFIKTVGARGEGKSYGINTVGLQRRGFSDECIKALKDCYRTLIRSKKILEEAAKEMREKYPEIPEVVALLDFIASSERGFHR